MVVCAKKQKQCLPGELEVGDCWIAITLANSSGLILAVRVGKHTDKLLEELVVSTEGKRACKQWNSDDWGGYERVLPSEIEHYIGKDQTQRLERINGIVRRAVGAICPTAEQVWQALGAEQGDNALSGELFQLDMAAQPIQDDGSATSRAE